MIPSGTLKIVHTGLECQQGCRHVTCAICKELVAHTSHTAHCITEQDTIILSFQLMSEPRSSETGRSKLT